MGFCWEVEDLLFPLPSLVHFISLAFLNLFVLYYKIQLGRIYHAVFIPTFQYKESPWEI